MAEPQGHFADVSGSLEQEESTAMSKLMRRYGASSQRRTSLRCCGGVFIENVLEARAGHGSPFRIHEQLRYRHSPPHGQPGTEIDGCFLPERKTSFLAALAENPNAGRLLKGEALQREPYQLRDPQTPGEAEMQHRTVPNSQS